MNLEYFFAIDPPTIIQGMTGREGQRMAASMIARGAHVIAGVTPGKGGQEVLGVPIFNSVQDAITSYQLPVTSYFGSAIVVPPAFALGAIKEAIKAGVKVISVLTEGMRVTHLAEAARMARERGVLFFGPASIGLSVPDHGWQLGFLGGFDRLVLTPGTTSILSGSGGMGGELVSLCARNNFGVRIAAALGGEPLRGLEFSEAIELVEADPGTERIIAHMEPEPRTVQWVVEARAQGRQSKPLAVVLAGKIMQLLPRGVAYGHAGTILGENESVDDMRQALAKAGVYCVSFPDELIGFVE